MQNATKMILTSILSLAIGIAFASPLFYSDTQLTLVHFVSGGTIADVKIDVAYADFQVQPADANTQLPSGFSANETAYKLTYYVVLNVTNNYDKATMVDQLWFTAARNAVRLDEYIRTGEHGWISRANGAWVDGVWYNATWRKGMVLTPFDDHGDLPPMQSYNTSDKIKPYLDNGSAIIYDRYINGSIISTYMDMNGTWVDVTGRINVTRPALPNTYGMLYNVASELRFFRNSGGDVVMGVGTSVDTCTLIGTDTFNNTWKPYESRLVLLQGTRIVESSVLETLNSGNIFISLQAGHFLTPQVVDGKLTSTHGSVNITGQIQLQKNGDNYQYNSILSPDQMFVPDQYNVQVTVEPRR